MNNTNTNQPSRAWIQRMADKEDRCQSVVAGGLAGDLGMLEDIVSDRPRVLGRLVEWCRIRQGLSKEQFAKKAGIEVDELRAVEEDDQEVFHARLVYKLSQSLKLPAEKIMVLAGLAEERDESFDQATYRFAAQSSTAKLSKDQRHILEEYVKAIVDGSSERP